MAKTLLVMRHGKSSWKDESLTDEKRPLKKRGAKDAAYIGEVLNENELVPQIIFSSPAKRAKQTAKIVADVCGLKKALIYVDSFYMGESEDFFSHLRNVVDNIERVMIVAHNPGLENLVQVLDGRLERLPTGALAYLSLDLDRWADFDAATRGELIGFWDPREAGQVEMEQTMGKDKKDKKDKHEKKDKKDKKEKKEKKEKKDKK